MAELNLVFTVLCKHCGRPLYGRVKFCPYCGKEESITLVAGAANATRALGRETSDQAETQALIAVAPAAAPRHEVQEVVEIPAVPGAACKAEEKADSTTVRFAPPTLESQSKEPAPTAMPRPTPTPPRAAVLKRLGIGRVAAMALLLLALVLGPIYFNKQNEMAKLPELTSKLAQAQGALDRGDLAATQRAIGALAAAYPDDAGVRKLSEEFDQRMREQSDMREQPRSAASKAANELEIDSVPAPAPAPAQAPPTAEAPTTVVALPWLGGTAAPKEKTTCNQALVALALCPDEPMAETGSKKP